MRNITYCLTCKINTKNIDRNVIKTKIINEYIKMFRIKYTSI